MAAQGDLGGHVIDDRGSQPRAEGDADQRVRDHRGGGTGAAAMAAGCSTGARVRCRPSITTSAIPATISPVPAQRYQETCSPRNRRARMAAKRNDREVIGIAKERSAH